MIGPFRGGRTVGACGVPGRPAEFYIGVHRDAIVCLRDRVQKLVERDRRSGAVPLGKIVTRQHLRDRGLRHEPDEIGERQRREPGRVIRDLGALEIDDLRGLRLVVAHVRGNHFIGERRPRVVAPGRIADLCREVADEKDDPVAQFLELRHLM